MNVKIKELILTVSHAVLQHQDQLAACLKYLLPAIWIYQTQHKLHLVRGTCHILQQKMLKNKAARVQFSTGFLYQVQGNIKQGCAHLSITHLYIVFCIDAFSNQSHQLAFPIKVSIKVAAVTVNGWENISWRAAKHSC